MKANYKVMKRVRRHARIRSKVMGTDSRPRLAVFRSNAHIYAQIIDDTRGVTLASASDIKGMKGTKAARSMEVGKLVAANAKKAGITAVVFDRGGFQFTGRIKALAEAAREAGLSF